MFSVRQRAVGGQQATSRRTTPSAAAHDRGEPIDEVRRWDEAIWRPDRRGRWSEKGGDMPEPIHL
jgi:hypothetical protein